MKWVVGKCLTNPYQSFGVDVGLLTGYKAAHWLRNVPLTSHLSRTQTLITQISRLCQEIRNIKRQNKNQSNSTPKAEPREGAALTTVQEEETMDSNQCQDRTSIDGTDGSGCTYSSRSTRPLRSEYNHDTPSRHETSHPLLSSTPPQNNQGQPAA